MQINIPLIGAHDFPYLFSDQVASLLGIPLTWGQPSHDALGVFTLPTLWTWVYGMAFGLAGKIGLDFSLATLVLGIIPAFLLAWVGMGRLLKTYDLPRPARLIGQLVFSANTYILMLIDGGQLSLALAYALVPWTLAYLTVPAALIMILAVISFLDIRYLYLLAIPITLKVAFDKTNWRRYLVTGLLAGLVLVGLHSYWIMPGILTRGPSLPISYTRATQVEALSFAKKSHALLLVHPHWPDNIFGKVAPPKAYFWLLPVLAFFPLLIKRKSKQVWYWLVLALVSVFLIKGGNPPLPNVYGWLFTHIPGFSLFRDPTKFFPLATLAYGVLIAFSAEFFWRNLKPVFVFLPVYLLLILIPIKNATGLFSIARHQEAYRQLAHYLERDRLPGSILWIPSKPPLGYSSPIHPSLDARVLLEKRPFAVGVVGSYELLNFLREASYSGQLLDVAGVKYLGISAVDRKRDSLKPEDLEYHEIFSRQLANLPWVRQARKFGEVTLLQTENHQPLFFIPSVTYFVVGPDNFYSKQNLTQTGMVFVESQPNLLSRISEFSNAELVLNGKTPIDAAAALVERKYLTFPSHRLKFDPDSTGWWKRETSDLIAWRDFLQQKYSLDNQDFDYGGGWSVSEGNNTLSLDIPKCQPECILLARVMISPLGGKINLNNFVLDTVDSTQAKTTIKLSGFEGVGDQYFEYDLAKFHWFEVGEISGQSLTIATEGTINVVSAIAVLPKSVWDTHKAQIDKLIPRKVVPTSAKIEYTKLNSAHYKVKISGLKGPSTLAFGQNYDPLWQLADKHGVPLYSMINGFAVDSDGEYELIFLPQRYVIPGLTVTIFTLILLLWLKNAYKQNSSDSDNTSI